MLNSLVLSKIDAKVEDGFECVAANVFGVLGVEDDIGFTRPKADAHDVALSESMRWSGSARNARGSAVAAARRIL